MPEENGSPTQTPARSDETGASNTRTREHYIECDGCGCTLTPKGKVFDISDKLRKMKDAQHDITALQAKYDAALVRITELEAEVKKLSTPATEPAPNGAASGSKTRLTFRGK